MENLIQQLNIKPATHIAILNPPEGYIEMLSPLEDSILMKHALTGTFDFIQIFVTHVHELDEIVTGVINSLKKDGTFWISYPREGSGMSTNLSTEVLHKELRNYGFMEGSEFSIDDHWMAMRFIPSENE